MPENTLPPGERTVVVNQTRFGILTIVSLCFNAFILLLLIIGLICHHHHRHHGQHGEWGRPQEWQGGHEREGMRFQHQDWGDRGPGWAHGPRLDRGEMGRGRPEGPDHGLGEFPGGPGRNFGGPEGMKPMHPPTPTEITDQLMQHLTRQLALTDQESTQIRPLIEQQVAQLQKDRETQRQVRAKVIDDTTAKIRPMLNADQQKQLDQFKTAMDQKLAPPPPPAPEAADQAKSKTQ